MSDNEELDYDEAMPELVDPDTEKETRQVHPNVADNEDVVTRCFSEFVDDGLILQSPLPASPCQGDKEKTTCSPDRPRTPSGESCHSSPGRSRRPEMRSQVTVPEKRSEKTNDNKRRRDRDDYKTDKRRKKEPTDKTDRTDRKKENDTTRRTDRKTDAGDRRVLRERNRQSHRGSTPRGESYPSSATRSILQGTENRPPFRPPPLKVSTARPRSSNANVCPVKTCSAKWTNEKTRVMHIQEHHTRDKLVYACPLVRCVEVRNTLAGLSKHMEHVHQFASNIIKEQIQVYAFPCVITNAKYVNPEGALLEIPPVLPFRRDILEKFTLKDEIQAAFSGVAVSGSDQAVVVQPGANPTPAALPGPSATTTRPSAGDVMRLMSGMKHPVIIRQSRSLKQVTVHWLTPQDAMEVQFGNPLESEQLI